jgi:hypothetical protein
VYAQSSVQPVFDTDTIGFFVTLAVLALFFITARMRRR